MEGFLFIFVFMSKKKVDIGAKEFTKLLEPLEYKPNQTLIKRIDSKMFSLDQNKVFSYKPEQLAFQEYNRCLQLFEQRNPGLSPDKAKQRMAGSQVLIVKAEAPHREQLENLAIETIRDIYQVHAYVDLKAMIRPRLSLDVDQDDDPEPFLELTLEQKNSMRDEIYKRQILNGLVHGSSMHVWKGIYHLVSDELDKINPQLRELYNYYTSTLGIALWMKNPNQFQQAIEEDVQWTQGYNTLKFDKEKGYGGQIQAAAINFPVMLHELNKGVVDWLISAGIPQSYSEDELRYYYAIADDYKHEVYHYLLSPTLWIGLLDAAKVSNENLPKLISRLTKLSYQELVTLFRLIQDNPEQAKEKIKSWRIS